jgi:hypothetical protein
MAWLMVSGQDLGSSGSGRLAKTPIKADEQQAEGAKTPEATPSAPEKGQPATPEAEPQPELSWREALRQNNRDAFVRAVAKQLRSIIAKHKNLKNYEPLILFDDDSITRYHSDRLYSAARSLKAKGKDILLVIESPGGEIEPAYLISKTLKRLAANKFAVAVPRRAKSAATLICLGADEVHMGMISQLGPIDPQISGLPALALGNAMKHIAELAQACPGASDVLAKYLIDQAPIRTLGYYERVSESAAQYAERLLAGRNLPGGRSTTDVAKHLVQHYKDHSFVIDCEEALGLLGSTLIKEQTPEYVLADEIYSFLDFAQLVANLSKKRFWIVGDPDDAGWRDIK